VAPQATRETERLKATERLWEWPVSRSASKRQATSDQRQTASTIDWHLRWRMPPVPTVTLAHKDSDRRKLVAALAQLRSR